MPWTDYENSTYRGGVQFSDTWNQGAQYQQLKGGSGVNADLDAHFNSLDQSGAGGANTNTVADDGEGWILLQKDGGKTSNDRVAQYRAIAEKWQAAGYDVRVQDHNPEFGKKKGSEIAIRKGTSKAKPVEQAPEKLLPPTDSPHLAEAKERVQNWEKGVEIGQSSHEIFGQNPTDYDFTNNQFTRYDKPNPYTQSNKATELLDTYKTGFSNVSSAADSNNENALTVALPNAAGSAQPIADFSSVKNEEEDPYSWQTQVGMR